MRDQQITGRLELLLFFIYFCKKKKDCTKFISKDWINLILCSEKRSYQYQYGGISMNDIINMFNSEYDDFKKDKCHKHKDTILECGFRPSDAFFKIDDGKVERGQKFVLDRLRIDVSCLKKTCCQNRIFKSNSIRSIR